MQLSTVPEQVAQAGLRALYTVACADGEYLPIEQAFLYAVRTHILRTDAAIEKLETITAQELAREIPPGEFRSRMLAGAVVMSCIDGKTTEDEVAVLDGFAKALEVDPAPVNTARKLAKEQLFLARIDIARRALAGHKVKQTVQEEGLLATIKQFVPLLGGSDDAVAAKYRALAAYPAGTLGRAYYDFVSSNHFSFPGEKHAGPEIIVVHDCIHVLGGFGTSATEEINVSAFQAGCHSSDPLYGMLFGLAQYHLGVQVAPVAPGEKMNADPEQMVQAFVRGTKVKRDLWSAFRPWDHFAQPLDAL